jgi:hypothetical protein
MGIGTFSQSKQSSTFPKCRICFAGVLATKPFDVLIADGQTLIL